MERMGCSRPLVKMSMGTLEKMRIQFCFFLGGVLQLVKAKGVFHGPEWKQKGT
jgi:hypothetical protein